MTPEQINRVVTDARQLAKRANLKLTQAGDGLFRLQGQEHLMSAGQIVQLLNGEPPKKVRKTKSDKGKTHQRRRPSTKAVFVSPNLT